MGIYAGGSKCRLVSGGKASSLFVPSPIIITNGALLVSSDGHILQDKRRLYLTLKDNIICEVNLLSLDDCISNDINGLYLMANDDGVFDMKSSTLDDHILQDSNELYLTIRKDG